jgi:hypothetical protein
MGQKLFDHVYRTKEINVEYTVNVVVRQILYLEEFVDNPGDIHQAIDLTVPILANSADSSAERKLYILLIICK